MPITDTHMLLNLFFDLDLPPLIDSYAMLIDEILSTHIKKRVLGTFYILIEALPLMILRTQHYISHLIPSELAFIKS